MITAQFSTNTSGAGMNMARILYPWAKSQGPHYCSLSPWCSIIRCHWLPGSMRRLGKRRSISQPSLAVPPATQQGNGRGEGQAAGGGGGAHSGTKGGCRVINLLPNSLQEVREGGSLVIAVSVAPPPLHHHLPIFLSPSVSALTLITPPLLCQVYIQFSLCLITSQCQVSIHLSPFVLYVLSCARHCGSYWTEFKTRGLREPMNLHSAALDYVTLFYIWTVPYGHTAHHRGWCEVNVAKLRSVHFRFSLFWRHCLLWVVLQLQFT